jgi:hypothetical protein
MTIMTVSSSIPPSSEAPVVAVFSPILATTHRLGKVL